MKKSLLSFMLLVSCAVLSLRAVDLPLPVEAVAIWGDGTTLVTQQELDTLFDTQIKGQPQLQGAPEAVMLSVKENLLHVLVSRKVVSKWVSKNNIDQTDDYKAMCKKIMEDVILRVNVEFFLTQFEGYTPTDEELKEFYEKNKDRIALKKDGTYVVFDDIKDQVKRLVLQAKEQEAATKKLQELKDEFGVQINENAWGPKNEEQK